MYYLLWKTRNGQQQWSGPYQDEEAARRGAERNLHAQETGDWFIVRLAL
jgi:hypothetical protein